MTASRDEVRLRHMLTEARKLVLKVRSRTRADLDMDEDLAAVLAWRLGVIGEAAARVSQQTRDQNPQIPWSQIVGLRNRLVHGYDRIDLDLVWQIIIGDLPPLLTALVPLVPPEQP